MSNSEFPDLSSPTGQLASPQPQGQRTNGWAIASLVCGIIGCLPFVTSLAAIILGFSGIRNAKDPRIGGKSLAVAGLVLGIVGLTGWTLIAGFVGTAYVASKPARVVAHQFALDLSNGNVNAAAANSGGMTQQQLASVVQQMQPWGTLTDTWFDNFNTHWGLDGATTCSLSGTASFKNGGNKTYTVTLVKNGTLFRVHSFNFK